MDNPFLAIQIALVMGLNEAIKKAFLREAHYKFIPLIALVLGVTGSTLFFPGDTVQQSIIDGLIIGLGSVGLFSLIKHTGKLK